MYHNRKCLWCFKPPPDYYLLLRGGAVNPYYLVN